MPERMSIAEYRELIGKKQEKPKYGNRKTPVDGIMFDSKDEAERYSELKLSERAGLIKELKLQVKYQLIPKQAGERAATYTVDFDYYENGRHIVEDVKGHKTQQYVLRRKMFKQLYTDIEFREIKQKGKNNDVYNRYA